MSTKNDITGDSIQSRGLSEEGRENWQRIFGRVEDKVEDKVEDRSAHRRLRWQRRQKAC